MNPGAGVSTGTLEITVIGLPAPQGSKKFVGLAKSGRGILVESSKRVKPWREAVKHAAWAEIAKVGLAGLGMVRGPVEVEMIFTMPKPKSAPKRRRTWPDRTPDLSKLVRASEDALTEAGAWEDDARVVKCTSSKVFPGEGAGSLHVPGALIRISPAVLGQETLDVVHTVRTEPDAEVVPLADW